MTETIPRRVGLNDLDWLAEPGEYRIAESMSDADRARLQRHGRKVGNTVRTSRDTGFLRVTVWKGLR